MRDTRPIAIPFALASLIFERVTARAPDACAARATALASVSAALLAAVALAAPAAAGSVRGGTRDASAPAYTFQTLDNSADARFNGLTGINDAGVIAGYYGSGSSSDPSSGYTIVPPYGQSNYSSHNYFGSAQTRIVGIDSDGDLLGYEVDKMGNGENFVEVAGSDTLFPEALYAINAGGIALWDKQHNLRMIGQFNDFVYLLDEVTGRKHLLSRSYDEVDAGFGLNDEGDIVGLRGGGYFIQPLSGWAIIDDAHYSIAFPVGPGEPKSWYTQPNAIDNQRDIAGTVYYREGSSFATISHGFVVNNVTTHAQYTMIDDPAGPGTTSVTGVNDSGQIVGTYVDRAGNTHGFLATPAARGVFKKRR